MDFSVIWESLVMVTTGFLLLRLSGRKSIAQTSIPTTIVMISIGSIIVQPIIDDSIMRTVIAVSIFIGVLILVEILQLKFNSFENLLTGRSVILIKDGKIQIDNLKKVRMTVDKIEAELRQKGISDYTQIKVATIEPNGQLGYELKDDAKPLTVGQFKNLMNMAQQTQSTEAYGHLFYEVIQKGHTIQPPKDLN